MNQAMLETSSAPKVHFLYEQTPERQKIHAFAIAQKALITALLHVRAKDGNVLRAMANTRRALDAIQDMRQLIN
jgi:endonuclease III